MSLAKPHPRAQRALCIYLLQKSNQIAEQNTKFNTRVYIYTYIRVWSNHAHEPEAVITTALVGYARLKFGHAYIYQLEIISLRPRVTSALMRVKHPRGRVDESRGRSNDRAHLVPDVASFRQWLIEWETRMKYAQASGMRKLCKTNPSRWDIAKET